MKLPIYQVDAFTRQVFGGNPAAVVVLKDWLSDDVLQRIAGENNLSETAFCVADGDNWQLRWFTPTAEVDLCGHATLATAHVLLNHGYASGAEELHFSSQSGPLTVRRDGERLELNFPSRKPTPVPVTDEIAAALGARPEACFASRDLLAVFASEADVAALSVDSRAVAQLSWFAVVATAPGDEVDFVSRFFVPKAGIDEDPVTGSAHCSLTPYWAERLGKKSLTARQISARVGDLDCTLADDRVLIAGSCVDYLKGEIYLDG